MTLLNKYIEEKDFNFYSNIIKDFSAFIIVSNDLTGKEKTAPTLLKNLHLLYLYFSNYPYLFGVLTDEEIDETLSQFKEEFNKDQTIVNLAAGYNVLVKIAYLFDFAVDNGLSILNEKERLKIFHKTLIEIICSNDQLKDKKSYEELSEYYQIKNFLRDIDFCLGKVIIDIIKNSCKNYPLELDIYNTYSDNEKRSFLYKLYRAIVKLYNENKQEDEYIKAYNKAIKYNDTIVLGEEQFFNSIKKIDLPCQNIYYLKSDGSLDFFLFPKKINKKYKIIKYFVIMNEKYGNKYLETIRYISDVFGIKFGVIIYIQNKYIKINKEIIQHPFLHIILAYNEKDILNYYYDSIIRMKDINLHFLEENEALEKKIIEIDYKFPKLNETKIIKEEDNGWDMIRNLNTNIFKLAHICQFKGGTMRAKFTNEMYKVYKENNCLDLFTNYYGNYFIGEYLVEQFITSLCIVKLFLYAYTLQEKNGKSFYSLMNNDLRSGNPYKIRRYIIILKAIYELLKQKYLKSYSGEVYRATWFKNELIDEIKPGKKMLNASLWSSSKKLSVAKKFLFKYKKNVLLHTKVKEGNNIDIHLEKISQFENEEEILFLPFCAFEVKSFEKVKENNLEYYNLELIYCEEENKIDKIEEVQYKDIDTYFNF